MGIYIQKITYRMPSTEPDDDWKIWHTYITYIHTCIYTHIYTYTYAYIHTYTHTYVHTYGTYRMLHITASLMIGRYGEDTTENMIMQAM